MRREFIAHTREPIPEARLTDMATECGVSLHEVKPLEVSGSHKIGVYDYHILEGS
jgi:hypothetical protein